MQTTAIELTKKNVRRIARETDISKKTLKQMIVVHNLLSQEKLYLITSHESYLRAYPDSWATLDETTLRQQYQPIPADINKKFVTIHKI